MSRLLCRLGVHRLVAVCGLAYQGCPGGHPGRWFVQRTCACGKSWEWSGA